MAKTRKEKEGIVLKLGEQLESAKSAVLVNYKGLTVSETEELRDELRKNNVSFAVTKNKLFNIALNDKGIKIDKELMDQPIAVAFGTVDEIAAAKGINEFAKTHEAVEILGGLFANEYIDKDRVMVLANIPSRDELYAKIVGSLAAPLSGMVTVLSGNLRGLVSVLSQYKDQRSANN